MAKFVTSHSSKGVILLIDSYYVFDVDSFFRDYKKNKRKLEDIKYRIEQIPSMGGMDYSTPRVSGSVNSDTTASKAHRIAVLKEEAKEIEEYLETVNRVLDALTEEERTIVKMYYNMESKEVANEVVLSNITEKIGIHRATIYEVLKEIRSTVRYMIGRY